MTKENTVNIEGEEIKESDLTREQHHHKNHVISLRNKIAKLQSGISPNHRKPLPPIPTMRPEEVPEKQREYTKETLLKFKEEKAAMDEAEKMAAAGLGEGGLFGGFGGGRSWI